MSAEDGKATLPPTVAPADGKPDAQPIRLPGWIDEAGAWLDATKRLAELMAREDEQVTKEARQIRGFRKLLDFVLERVAP